MNKQEREELLEARNNHRILGFKGVYNKCPKCFRTGEFGSIITYRTESGNEFIICGWCNNITEVIK